MEEKKQLILEAALGLFVTYGFHGTPTSKIAQEAGVANGTLFHYFPTKEDLVIALYVDIKNQMGCYVTDNAPIVPNLRETLRKQYLASLYWALDHPTEFRFIEQFVASPYLQKVAAEEVQKRIKPFMELLQKGMDEKTIRTMPVDLLFTLISSHIYGINNYLINHQMPKVQEHALISDSFEWLWSMIT
ncbi:MAG: TetR/AcrR family transcriptional regulator [Bacteroidetes bacterium]|nr:TetR/AcrR family transcriptional regulator [Bacteroidota bacterium]